MVALGDGPFEVLLVLVRFVHHLVAVLCSCEVRYGKSVQTSTFREAVETVVKEAASGGHAEGGEEAALDLRLADGVQIIVGEALQFICFHHSVI